MQIRTNEPVSPKDVNAKVVKINNKPLIIPKIGYITLWFQEIPNLFLFPYYLIIFINFLKNLFNHILFSHEVI